MSKVYRQRSNGALWVISHGDLGRCVGLDGTRYYQLEPVNRLFAADRLTPVAGPDRARMYAELRKHHALDLVVTKQQLDNDFEAVPELVNRGNDPIEKLMAEYEADGCDHSNVEWLVRASYRYVDTMADSQVRCLLYAMARRLDAELGPREAPGG